MRKKSFRVLLSLFIMITIIASASIPVSAGSGYHLYINCEENVVTLYDDDVPVKAFLCSTGSATPHSGTYYTSTTYRWAVLKGGVYGQFCTIITGSIWFHSVPYCSHNNDDLEYWEYDKLGTACSAGCVRLAVEDAEWLYDNLSWGTPVTFYDSSDPGPLGKPLGMKIADAPSEYRCWDPTDDEPENPWRYDDEYTKYTFDADYYRANNPDLKSEVRDTDLAYKIHWITYGINEKRRASEDFDLSTYMKMYRNAGNIYGGDNYSYVKYFNTMGKNLGQSGTVNTDNYQTASGVNVKYRTHVQWLGWQDMCANGITSGTEGRGFRVEALSVSVDSPYALGVRYRTHVQDIGWMKWVNDGEISGTTGWSLRVEALQLQLTGSASQYFDICYRVYVEGKGWSNWVKNGTTAGTTGYGLRLEAIQIRVVAKDSTAYSSVSYNSHIENIGWQPTVTDGLNSGLVGRSLRLEGVRITVNDPLGVGIEYRAHVQNIGWMNWVRDGQLAGTTGWSLRLEGLQIRLIGPKADLYNVYYKTYVQNIGWTDWAKNGEKCGSEGLGYRVEALKVIIVSKGSSISGSTFRPFYT